MTELWHPRDELVQMARDQAQQTKALDAVVNAGRRRAARLWLMATAEEPTSPLYVAPGSPHWHFTRHSDDEEPLVERSLILTLEYIAPELDLAAENESEVAAQMREAAQFKDAVEAADTADRFAHLAQMARRVHTEATSPPWDRFSTYADKDEAVNRERILIAANHTADLIRTGGPRRFQLWTCADNECVMTSDQDEDEEE